MLLSRLSVLLRSVLQLVITRFPPHSRAVLHKNITRELRVHEYRRWIAVSVIDVRMNHVAEPN